MVFDSIECFLSYQNTFRNVFRKKQKTNFNKSNIVKYQCLGHNSKDMENFFGFLF